MGDGSDRDARVCTAPSAEWLVFAGHGWDGGDGSWMHVRQRLWLLPLSLLLVSLRQRCSEQWWGRTTNGLDTRCWDGIAATPGGGAGDSHPLIVAVPAEPTKESIDIICASGTSPRICCQSLPEERDLIFEVKYARCVGIALIHVVVDREPDLGGLDHPES